jgi:hypothetical protein
MVTRESARPASAEQRLEELGIKHPAPPEPFGTYAEAVQTGNLLFLTGMLPTEGRAAKFVGRVGAELDVETGRKAAYLAALNQPPRTGCGIMFKGSRPQVNRALEKGKKPSELGLGSEPKCNSDSLRVELAGYWSRLLVRVKEQSEVVGGKKSQKS